jgi:DNA-binding transcriptional LysR family regulator
MVMALPDRIRLQQLRCFVTVASTRHLGRAAERLHLTQPAVSKALSTLEDAIGHRVMTRGRHGARLTEHGERLLPHAVAVLDALTRASTSLLDEPAESGVLIRVGALPTVAPDLLPSTLLDLGRTRPDARVIVHTAANAPLMDALKAGAIDIAVGRMSDPGSMTGLTFELLYVEPLILVVRLGHPLTNETSPSTRLVAGFPLVLAARDTVPRQNTESWLHASGITKPTIRLETLSVSVARLFVEQTDAVWIVPFGAVRADLARGRICRLNVPTTGTEEPVGLLRRRDDEPAQAVADFVLALRGAAERRDRTST